MRHADIRAMMNICGDALTADMAEAHGKIVGLVLKTAQTDRKVSKSLKSGGRGRNRTFNLSVKSRMLCQLSYAPLSLAPWRSPPQNEG